MTNRELIKQISISPENRWFIFNLSELEQKEVERDEKWGWTFYTYSDRMQRRRGIEMIRNIRTEGHPENHRREIIVQNSSGVQEWHEDRKTRLSPEETARLLITDVLRVKVKLKNHLNLSPFLQNDIIESLGNYLFQGRRRRRPRQEMRDKLQSVMFVDISMYDRLKEWIIFDKQWLYEQIRTNQSLPDCFVVGGPCSCFQTKNDIELKTFLQQEGLLPEPERTNQPRNSLATNLSIPLNPISESSNSNNSSSYTDNNNSSSDSSFSDSDSEIYYSSISNNDKRKANSSESINSTQVENPPPKESSPEEFGEQKQNNLLPISDNFPKGNSEIVSSSESSFKNQPTDNQSSFILADEGTSIEQKKQQVIQEIQAQLAKLPNKDLGEYQNWKQEIEQMQNLTAITAYQDALLQSIVAAESEIQDQKIITLKVETAKDNKQNILIIFGIIIFGIILFSTTLIIRKNYKKNQ